MIPAALLAWSQLWFRKARLAVALAGVAFAVVLIFMQLGFMDALYRSAVNVHRTLAGQVVLLSPHYNIISVPTLFPRVRVDQARAVPGVVGATAIYTGVARWKNPETHRLRDLFTMGVDPARQVFDLPALELGRTLIRYPDVTMFDVAARPELGPVPARVAAEGSLVSEANRHEVTVRGLFRFGTSFGVDGTMVTSQQTFHRIFPDRPVGAVSIGLLRLAPDADPRRVRATLNAILPKDVMALTIPEYMAREIFFWATISPIGYVFTFGVIMGVIVGAIIVYQILFADISDHLAEYATAKAIGHTDRYLSAVVLTQATILAVLGYLPGMAAAGWLYGVSGRATKLPLALALNRSLLVLGLTAGMCWLSALLAMRKLRAADPAEIF